MHPKFGYMLLVTSSCCGREEEGRGLLSSSDSVRWSSIEPCIAISSLLSETQCQTLIKPLLINLFDDRSWRVRCVITDKFLQDSVRWSSIEPCIAISSLLSETQCQTLIKPLLINLFDDRSWRVRCVITDKFLQIQEALGESVSVAVLLPAFGSLLKDVEPEVRTRAAEKVEQFCAALPATDRETEILTHVLPSVEEISKDPSAHVKTALALNVMGLAPLLGSELTVEHLLPIFLTLLQDEVTEVRLNVISTFDKVHNVIDASQLSQSLIPAIVNLAKDCKWRIRLAVVEFVPLLAAQLGHELFDETILPLYLGWLKDPVFAVREAAVNILKQLTDQFGVDWTVNCIFPTVF
uniref:PPP2R1A n=1 Tax=Ascaris lumbricoides TaxID=6252 RepID=A0A0M3IRM2_ASCLU